eukprot:466810-Rhodomonas_salina.2
MDSPVESGAQHSHEAVQQHLHAAMLEPADHSVRKHTSYGLLAQKEGEIEPLGLLDDRLPRDEGPAEGSRVANQRPLDAHDVLLLEKESSGQLSPLLERPLQTPSQIPVMPPALSETASLPLQSICNNGVSRPETSRAGRRTAQECPRQRLASPLHVR